MPATSPVDGEEAPWSPRPGLAGDDVLAADQPDVIDAIRARVASAASVALHPRALWRPRACPFARAALLAVRRTRRAARVLPHTAWP